MVRQTFEDSTEGSVWTFTFLSTTIASLELYIVDFSEKIEITLRTAVIIASEIIVIQIFWYSKPSYNKRNKNCKPANRKNKHPFIRPETIP